MKITTFDPLILSKNPEDLIKLFEELGFEKSHHNEQIEEREAFRLKHPEGYHVDLVQNPALERDACMIRMNVDNFEEARELFAKNGFQEAPTGIRENDSSKSLGMIAPSGFVIGLVYHKK